MNMFESILGEVDLEEKDPIDNTADDEQTGDNSNAGNTDDYVDDDNEAESTDDDDEEEEDSDLEEQDADENENTSTRDNRTSVESESENETENQEEASENHNGATGTDGKLFVIISVTISEAYFLNSIVRYFCFVSRNK